MDTDGQPALKQLTAGIVGIIKEMLTPGRDERLETTRIRVSTPFSVVDRAEWVQSVKLWLEQGKELIGGLPDRNCPACESRQHDVLFESYDGYPFHVCRNCGAWFVPKQVNEAVFEDFYSRCPSARELAEKIVKQRLTPERAEQDRQRISQYLRDLSPFVAQCRARRSYLDVGCGLGYSLSVASELGFRARGIEVDASAVAIAREKGLRVDPPGGKLPSRAFGIISLWETIEHVDNPRHVLSSCLPALAKGGILALTFPNLNSPTVRLLKSDCVWVNGGSSCPGHINFFHVPAIDRLLSSLGLCILDVDAQFGLNRRELLLYSLGQHGGALEYLASTDIDHTVSRRALWIDNAIGPALSLMERILLLAPILLVVACRKEDEERFREVVSALRQSRTEQILAEAEAMTRREAPESSESSESLDPVPTA